MSCAWFRFASLVPRRGRFPLYHSDLCLFKPEICQSPELYWKMSVNANVTKALDVRVADRR